MDQVTDDANVYVREQVSKKWREHTLGDYSTNQVRYNPFLNEYDCCSQFGLDDESDEDESDDEAVAAVTPQSKTPQGARK